MGWGALVPLEPGFAIGIDGDGCWRGPVRRIEPQAGGLLPDLGANVRTTGDASGRLVDHRRRRTIHAGVAVAIHAHNGRGKCQGLSGLGLGVNNPGNPAAGVDGRRRRRGLSAAQRPTCATDRTTASRAKHELAEGAFAQAALHTGSSIDAGTGGDALANFLQALFRATSRGAK